MERYGLITYQINQDAWLIERFEDVYKGSSGPFVSQAQAERWFHRKYPEYFIIPHWLSE